ncbi:jg1558, partial [Pararge aegeria aegeria]
MPFWLETSLLSIILVSCKSETCLKCDTLLPWQGGAAFLWSALWLAGGAASLLARLGPLDRPPASVLFAAA